MPPIRSESSGPKVTKMWDGLKDLLLYKFNLIFFKFVVCNPC